MINKKMPLTILAETQKYSKEGLLKPDERSRIASACKSYMQTGDDDEFYEFLEWGSKNLTGKLSDTFKSIMEVNYNGNDDNTAFN